MPLRAQPVSSIVKKNRIEPANPRGAGDQVDCDDFPMRGGEIEYYVPVRQSPRRSHSPIDDRRLCGLRTSLENTGHWRCTDPLSDELWNEVARQYDEQAPAGTDIPVTFLP